MADNLYNDAILAVAKANHAAGRLTAPDSTVTCDNPLCGDRVTMDLKLSGSAIGELAQKTRGCLLTQAAASLIGQHGPGLTADQARQVTHQLERLLAGEPVEPAWAELAMFRPVQAVKSRHECVLLPFQALAEALREAKVD
jgi:nitrogen fixation NifU-like protein